MSRYTFGQNATLPLSTGAAIATTLSNSLDRFYDRKREEEKQQAAYKQAMEMETKKSDLRMMETMFESMLSEDKTDPYKESMSKYYDSLTQKNEWEMLQPQKPVKEKNKWELMYDQFRALDQQAKYNKTKKSAKEEDISFGSFDDKDLSDQMDQLQPEIKEDYDKGGYKRVFSDPEVREEFKYVVAAKQLLRHGLNNARLEELNISPNDAVKTYRFLMENYGMDLDSDFPILKENDIIKVVTAGWTIDDINKTIAIIKKENPELQKIPDYQLIKKMVEEIE